MQVEIWKSALNPIRARGTATGVSIQYDRACSKIFTLYVQTDTTFFLANMLKKLNLT